MSEALQDTDDLLLNRPVDYEEAKATKKASQLTAGLYQTVPKLDFKVYLETDGAYTVAFFGSVQGDEDAGKIGFRLRDKVRIKEESGKPDNASKLYAEAVLVYNKAFGAAPRTLKDLVEYIQNYPVSLKIVNGSDSPIVVNVRPVAA